jgi:hypothetical protein
MATIVQGLSFQVIRSALAKQFKAMSDKRLFQTTADGEALWSTYLGSFPVGANPIYKTRTEHDCGCCRHFIKHLGGVVNIVDGKVITLWDFKVDGYQEVVDAMAAYVRGIAIGNVYLHYDKMVGTANSRQLLEDKSVKTWEHFHVNLPAAAVVKKEQIGPKGSEHRATHDVMLRGLSEITLESVDTTLDLIAQNSLYRGEEHKFAVAEFRKLLVRFLGIVGDTARDLFVWEHMESIPASVSRIRGTVIGTLLVDLSEGKKDLEDAVKLFESKVAPANYKRPTALVTKAMVAQAQAKVDELGLHTALERRYATLDDLTVNNILFADRATKKAMNVFDDIAAGTAVDVKKLGKVEEVSIADFIGKVLPSAQAVEALFENRHTGNLVSLIAPVDPTAKPLFKWPNGFSWSYVGDFADSIKERVKQAGGNVTGDFRASLAWFNHDDLDLHLKGPGLYIWFRDKVDRGTGGNLDVDMNAGSGQSRTPVENITFPKREIMPEGEYTLFVNQFCQRESIDGGFELEVEFDGTVYSFSWPTPIKTGLNVCVCKFKYSRKEGLTILESLPAKQTSKTVWNLPTQTFHKVRATMLSPNMWDGREIGNRHFFFMLDGCQNDGTARGFFNEFLSESLTPHRKVLEMVGARMKTEASDAQLSGLGFSSTKRDFLLCRVTGSFTRVVKVLF